LDDIKVENVEESKKIIMDILAGTQSTARDIVVLNAGAAIYVSGITEDITSGIDQAKRAIDSGKAQEKLAELVTKSNG
jgi:anthranilate phosphoribosyltransferase